MLVALLGLPHWFWHPLNGQGYQFWSGIGSDFGELSIAVAIFASVVAGYRRRNCHVSGCWRVAWHPDPVHGHPVCRRHHPHAGRVRGDSGGGTTILKDRSAA